MIKITTTPIPQPVNFIPGRLTESEILQSGFDVIHRSEIGSNLNLFIPEWKDGSRASFFYDPSLPFPESVALDGYRQSRKELEKINSRCMNCQHLAKNHRLPGFYCNSLKKPVSSNKIQCIRKCRDYVFYQKNAFQFHHWLSIRSELHKISNQKSKYFKRVFDRTGLWVGQLLGSHAHAWMKVMFNPDRDNLISLVNDGIKLKDLCRMVDVPLSYRKLDVKSAWFLYLEPKAVIPEPVIRYHLPKGNDQHQFLRFIDKVIKRTENENIRLWFIRHVEIIMQHGGYVDFIEEAISVAEQLGGAFSPKLSFERINDFVHEAVAERELRAAQLSCGPGIEYQTSPEPLTPGYKSSDWKIQPLRNLANLQYVSSILKNCVCSPTYIRRLMRGEIALYSLSKHFGTMSVCIELEIITDRTERLIKLVQARGFRNKPPTDEEGVVINEWLSMNGIQP